MLVGKKSARAKKNVLSVVALFFFVAVARAANMSSMEIECFIDNGETPAVRVVPDGSSAEVFMSGPDDCALYVDGLLAAQTAGGSDLSYSLTCSADTWRSYELTLVSNGESVTKFVTFVPSSGFSCSMHSLGLSAGRLDSRQAGTIRSAKPDDILPVAYSGMWSALATGAEVKLYSGHGATDSPLATLVSSEGNAEGDFTFLPKALALDGGIYTLTHFDGVETLVAYLKLTGTGMILLFR